MSRSNCCCLICIQISQEAGKVVWYSHLFKSFPKFLVIHTVKGFGVINKAEGNISLEFSWFYYDPMDVGNLISGSSAFSNPAGTFGISQFTRCWSLAWGILSITLLACGGFPGGLQGKASACNEGDPALIQDLGSIPGSGRSLGEGNGNPLQYSCLKNPMNRGDECSCAVLWTFFGITFLWDWNENWPFAFLWPLLSFFANLLAYWMQHFHSIIFYDFK